MSSGKIAGDFAAFHPDDPVAQNPIDSRGHFFEDFKTNSTSVREKGLPVGVEDDVTSVVEQFQQPSFGAIR